MLLIVLLCLEVAVRVMIEIRERRLSQFRGGLLSVMRIIPLVNDIVPLPENRCEPENNLFVE